MIDLGRLRIKYQKGKIKKKAGKEKKKDVSELQGERQ